MPAGVTRRPRPDCREKSMFVFHAQELVSEFQLLGSPFRNQFVWAVGDALFADYLALLASSE